MLLICLTLFQITFEGVWQLILLQHFSQSFLFAVLIVFRAMAFALLYAIKSAGREDFYSVLSAFFLLNIAFLHSSFHQDVVLLLVLLGLVLGIA